MQRLCRAAFFPLRHASRLITTAPELNPVENSIRQKLTAEFQPLHMDVINESDQHSVSLDDAETHFKVVLISEKFDKQSLVKRHRMVHAALQEELKAGVHALSIIETWADDVYTTDHPEISGPSFIGLKHRINGSSPTRPSASLQRVVAARGSDSPVSCTNEGRDTILQ